MFENIIIRDVFGQVRDEAWLHREYGDVALHRAAPGPGWRLLEIQENRDVKDGEKPEAGHFVTGAGPFQRIAPQAAATLICKALTADGRPAVDLPVAWYWPDAPEDPVAMPTNGLPHALWPNRAVHGFTNLNGDSGFAMGPGGYYKPGAKQGPHACWIYGQNSDVLFGLGMRERSNHDHLDFTFSQTAEEPPPPPPPPPPPVDELLAKFAEGLHYIQAECAALLELLAK